MEINLKADSGRIELAAYNYAKDSLVGIVDKIGAGKRNSSVNPDSSVYFNAPVVILNLDAIAKTTMRIEIYVKDIAGAKDSTKISQIRDILVPLFKGVTLDDSYFMAHVNDISGDDNAGFSFVFLNLAVTVV